MKGVIGIDEVGRGPLAGPVTVAAVFLNDAEEIKQTIFGDSIRDSKKLSISLRNNIFSMIRKKRNIIYAVASRPAVYIDKHGIAEAIHVCMLECLDKLVKKGVDLQSVPINLDGGLRIRKVDLKQVSHIKGDETFTEIALASIVAKVSRDNYMMKVHEQFPMYGFSTNVGYGTLQHCEAIKLHGVTKYHRSSFLRRILTI